MDETNAAQSDEEYFDCLSNVQYCAIASPKGKGSGEVFLDFDKARSIWKHIKGSRMKVFADFQDAKQFAQTPVENLISKVVCHPSPKADVEVSPFSSVPQGVLVQLRGCIEKGDVAKICHFVDDNPLTLVTSSDTPTLFQVRLRYNALHVAASSGAGESLACVLEYLNSSDVWCRIYPNVGERESRLRQKHVLDLYLNSPELGNYETPLHFASKFGHVKCARLLVSHPLTHLEPVNREGKTPLQVADSRLSSVRTRIRNVSRAQLGMDGDKPVALSPTSMSRVFDQSFVVLADMATASRTATSKASILGPVKLHALQDLLAKLYGREFPGLKHLLPHYHWLLSTSTDSTGLRSSPAVRHQTASEVVHIRAFAGPMLTAEAVDLRSKWLQANNSANWQTFGSLRLTDGEKGYERQGRYFSRCLQTDWYEYWGFLDDFLDLSSEKGLSKLEEHLSTVKNEITQPLQAKEHHPMHSFPQESRNRLDFPKDNDPPSTPILRQRHRADNDLQSTPVTKADCDPWSTYRSTSTAVNMLNDTLDESGESCPKLSSSSSTDDEIRGSPIHRSLMSPIVHQLRRLQCSSPFRWFLSDRLCSSPPILQSLEEQAYPSKQKRPFPVTSNGLPASTASHAVGGDTDGVDNEPATKKSSPSKRASTRRGRSVKLSELPALVGHIYRALPTCDTELDKAVASVADGGVVRSQLPAPTSKHQRGRLTTSLPPKNPPASLSPFEQTRKWKAKIETLI